MRKTTSLKRKHDRADPHILNLARALARIAAKDDHARNQRVPEADNDNETIDT